MGLRLRVDGIGGVVSRLDVKRLKTGYRRFFTQAAKVLRTAERGTVPVVSGRTRSQIKSKVSTKRMPGSAKVFVVGGRSNKQGRAHVARFLEYGTAPHEIRARGRGLGLPGGPRASVQHPGNAPRPFIEPAVRDSRGKIQDLAQKLADEIARAFGGG